MTNTWKVVIAVGAGAAVGITLGLLFAPEKGTEIRKRIAEQGRKIVDDLKDKIEEKKKEKFEARKNEWIERQGSLYECVSSDPKGWPSSSPLNSPMKAQAFF